ncbi:MAG: zinc ribbon domain-containing protein [Candidatus Omnitrophica bacterium]|nr:zinc ribbon domain-containing protein [Candidatus Omnitrophota bacterium]
MPTYEYQCDACSHQFEQFQSITAEAIKICPVCQGSVRRLIGKGGGIIFKGTGFYQTDYRSTSYQKKAEAEKKNQSEAKPTPSDKTASGATSVTAPSKTSDQSK